MVDVCLFVCTRILSRIGAGRRAGCAARGLAYSSTQVFFVRVLVSCNAAVHANVASVSDF